MRTSDADAIPTKRALLQELDGLGHAGRMRRMAGLGRAARGTPALGRLLEELLAGDAYEASLALQAGAAAGAGGELGRRALHHGSVLVRKRAAELAAALVPDDAALEQEVLGAAAQTRKLLLKGIALAARQQLAVRLLPQVLARWGATEAAWLLPGCDAGTVRRALPVLGPAALRSFRSLVMRHPDVLMEFASGRLEAAAERERPGTWTSLGRLLMLLAAARPREVLELALAFPLPAGLPDAIERNLGRFCLRHAELAFELLMRPGIRQQLAAGGLPRGVLKFVRSFSREQIAALARILAESPHHLASLLEALAPSARAEIFAQTYSDEALAGRMLPDALLQVLPHALREREARRLLALREVREDAQRTLAILAYRDIAAAREPLQKAAFAARAEDRARALALLVSCTGLSRRGMSETLVFAARIKNEQDPVRLAVFQALVAAPPSVYREEHLPALRRLVEDAAEARDISFGTRAAAQQLALALLARHAAEPHGALFRFALEVLHRLAGQTGSLALPSLESGLPRDAERHIVEALEPLIRAAEQRERHQLVLSLARALGRRGRNLEPLQALLEPALEAVPDFLAQQAIGYWLDSPRTRDGRVRRLLDRDPSVITIPRVLAHLVWRRQEWLDPFLDGTAVRGRFLTGKTIYLLPVLDGFHLWLPRQQRAFAALLERVATDTARSSFERASALQRLARIPAVEPETLERFTADPEVAVAEAALSALAWLDRQERSMPVLLRFLDGDRARVAMYALSRSVRFQAPEQLGASLAELLDRERLKVTVHKEAVRLLGAFRSERSVALLLREWQRPALHRDVRIAVGHAARKLLDEEEAWRILEALAVSPDPDLARSVLDERPANLHPAQRTRYAGLVLLVCRHPELEVRKLAFGAAGGWSVGVEERVAAAAAERMLDLEHGAEWLEATAALVEACRDGKAQEHLLRVAQELCVVPVPDAMNATRERDLPARQRLVLLCSRLLDLPGPNRVRLDPTLQSLSEALFEDPTLHGQAAALWMAGLGWKAAQPAAERLLALASRVENEPWLQPELATLVRSTLVAAPATDWEPEAVLGILDALIASPSPAAQMLAIGLLGAAGARLAWREDCGERLRRLRRHAHVAVRTAALSLRTAAE